MLNPFLITKLHVPPLRPDLVVRTELMQKLDKSYLHRQRVILITAPAGFGKSTLINAWLASKPEVSRVWLSLDEQDNDLFSFLSLLIAGLQQINSSIGLTIQQALQLPQPPHLSSVITALINDIAAHAPGELVLVLDDLHLITDVEMHQMLGLLIDYLPATVTTLIGTREEPSLPLARLRVRDQILEIREHDLRFALDETATFFRQTIKLKLTDDAIGILSARTEGWAAGIQLAALALQGNRVDIESFLEEFSGSDRYVADYLIEEVVQYLPVEIQDFLCQTSILDRLNASLCNILTGCPDSNIILEQLESSNLFLIALDYQREWYRYYRLFAEFLRGRLSAAEQQSLHLKAMRWHEDNGYPDQAFQHALAAASFDEAERLILKSAETMLHSGNISTLTNRLDTLPVDRLHNNANLAIYKGITLALTGQIESAEAYTQIVENRLNNQSDPETAGLLALLRTLIALAQRDDETASLSAQQALSILHQPNWRVMALWLRAEIHERRGDIQTAIESLCEARQIGFSQPVQAFTVMMDAFLASALHEHGQMQQAIGICQQAQQRYTDPSGEPLVISALVYARLALLMLECARIEEARQYHLRFEQYARQLFAEELHTLELGIRARILMDSGESAEALATLEALRQRPESRGLADTSWLVADEMNLHLRRGNLRQVRDWASRWPIDATPQYLHIEEHLAYVHYLVLSGDLDEAETQLAALQAFTESNGLQRRQIDVFILCALIAHADGELARARVVLIQALEIAAPQGYIRVFLNYGEPLLVLLAPLRSKYPAFIDSVLNAARQLRISTPEQPLAEPLSEREIEVLRLVAVGLSNSEIADRLVIALGTVKRHINHIYGKLDVRTRTQALIRAHELQLLDSDA